MDWPLRTGIFLAPFHPVGQNPTLALERDLELITRLDELGFDEAWIGEHHSAGYEIIASPEVFIATAAERTKNLRLGTGVSSLPYHHPLMLADRMVLLDHLTRGRVMLGCGPGALPSDAYMMGIDTQEQRHMMEESLEAIVALLEGKERVTREAGWFTLRDAELQLRPVLGGTRDRSRRTDLARRSPRRGPVRAAASCRSARRRPAASTSSVHTGMSWRNGPPSSAPRSTVASGDSSVRCTSPRPKSRRARTSSSAWPSGSTTSSGWRRYPWRLKARTSTSSTHSTPPASPRSARQTWPSPRSSGLIDQSGGFGTFLFMAHEWADREATLHSYELFARYVAPLFQGSTPSLVGSRDWAAANRPKFMEQAGSAIMGAIQEHHKEKAAKAANP